MEKRVRAQFAMEYVMIMGIALVIILAGVYLFRNYAYESNDKIVGIRLASINNDIVNKARKIYYYGPPSKSTIDTEMPPSLGNMFSVAHIGADPYRNEYSLGYTVLTAGGSTNILFPSDIPLKDAIGSAVCSPAPDPVCSLPSTFCYCFPPKVFSKGKKAIKVEAESCTFHTNPPVTMPCVTVSLP